MLITYEHVKDVTLIQRRFLKLKYSLNFKSAVLTTAVTPLEVIFLLHNCKCGDRCLSPYSDMVYRQPYKSDHRKRLTNPSLKSLHSEAVL